VSDGTVGLKQATAPDRLIDNVVVTNELDEVVYRQRVAVADLETGLAKEATLGSILTELGQKLEAGQAVALDATTLAALENITVTVANPTANPETGLAKDATLLRRYGDHVTKAGLVNTTGDNTLHTPAAGKRIRLYWIALSTSQDNTAENLIQVKLTDADGTVKYRWRMGNPGAFVGGRTIEGNVDEPLILNLATTDGVDWNVDLEEVT
jgi:hypothetical protein